jgi:integrase
MRNGRHQKGYIFHKGKAWYLRYYEQERQEGGTVISVQRCRKLADYGGEFRSEKSVRFLADEFLAPFNNGTTTVDSLMSLTDFIEKRYLPYVKEHKAPSTYTGYKNLWNRYIKERGGMALRDWNTCEGDDLLTDIARVFDLGKRTMQHIKSFLSGTFTYARRKGVLNGVNPMWDTEIPECRDGEDTYAYSLEEILTLIEKVPEPASTMIAIGGFAGPRQGEIRGLEIESYDGEQLWVKQSAWRSHVRRTKTKASKAPIPVIAPLAAKLDAHIATVKPRTTGLLFPNGANKPLDLQRTVAEVIRPALKDSGVEWHGWHALRRGLATNLHELGVQDKVIQAILRHANVSVTQDCYIKTTDPQAVKGMKKLERKVQHATNMQLAKQQQKKSAEVLSASAD